MKISSLLALSGALLCVAGAPAHSQTQPTAPAPTQTQDAWKMPDEEKEQWFQNLKRLVNDTSWIVSMRDNDFIIEYNEPVAFYSFNHDNPEGPNRIVSSKELLRVTLRFSPQISREDWMKQNSKNHGIVDLGGLISRGMDIKEKDGYYWVEGERDGEDAKTRADKYKQIGPRLGYRYMPQLFTLNRSVMVIQSWDERTQLDRKDDTAMSCTEMLGRIRRLFGSYSFVDARESWSAYSEKALSRPMFPTELHTEPHK